MGGLRTNSACAIALVITALGASNSTPTAQATILGKNLGPVLIYENVGGTDTIDTVSFNYDGAGGQNTVLEGDNLISLTGSGGQTAASITDSNTSGIAYALSSAGHVHRINVFEGTSTQIADLAGSGGHTTFSSITNLPGSDLLYILRTGSGDDFIDTFDPNTGIHTQDVFTTVNTGTIAISDGPANFGGSPSIYSIATGGSFEAFDSDNPGDPGVAISTGTTGLDTGDLVSITNLPTDTDSMYIMQDRTSPASQDRHHRFNLDGTRDNNLVSTTHTGGTTDAITDAYEGYVFSIATGASYTLVDPDNVGGTQFDDSSASTPMDNLQGTYTSATNLDEPSNFVNYAYIADHGTADHADVFDTRHNTAAGFTSNVIRGAATTPTGSAAFEDTSVTDGIDPTTGRTQVYQVHTDGRLYSVDAESGAQTLVADLGSMLTSPGVLTTFDSITNLEGSNNLYILRTDRPLGDKTGGGANDVIDIYDLETGTFTQAAFTTFGTGTISITDGPAFNDLGVDTEGGSALYTVANGGSFDVYDPDDIGSTGVQISGGTPGSDEYVSITNLRDYEDSLFLLRDAASNPDFIDRFFLDGTRDEGLFELVMGGAVSLTDTYENDLLAIATGGSTQLVRILRTDLANSPVLNVSSGITGQNGTYSSITNLGNLEIIPEPGTGGLVWTALLGLFAFRRRR